MTPEARAAADTAAVLGMPTDLLAPLAAAVIGHGPYDGVFPVSRLATAAVASTAEAAAELAAAAAAAAAASDRAAPSAEATPLVDARLASAWFDRAVRPRSPQPSPWHPLTADYRASDGWVRLHMNAPAHRAAALAVLGLVADSDEPGNRTDGADGAAPDTRADAAVPDRNEVAAAAERWSALALEEAVMAAGGCAAALRSAVEWAEHPQGRAVASLPLIVSSVSHARPVDEWPQGRPDRPLAGVRVLDLTRVLAGPVATRALALLGADVLRIDPPDWAEPALEPDMTLGKRCARVDAHDVEGASTLSALLAEAHVLVHGLRPGALEGLGLDVETRAALRPGLVEVQVSAYGPEGPWADRRGFDSLVQLATGIADARTTDDPEAAPRSLPVQALDHATGWLAATAALRGIAHARATGEGSRHHVSLARTARELRRMAELDGLTEEPGVALSTVALSIDVPETAPETAPSPDAFPAHPMESSFGTVDVLAAPFAVPGLRVEALQPPRPLGSDAPDWHAPDESARRDRGPRAVRVPRRRVPVWAALSGVAVWALQGVPLTLGAAMLGTTVPDPEWWTSPVWAAGAAAQALSLLVVWMLLSRWASIVGVLAATIPLGMLAHVAAATAVALATGAALPPALGAGLDLLTLHWASGAALIASSIPILLMLTPLGAGAGSLSRRAIAPRYARRGRGRRAA